MNTRAERNFAQSRRFGLLDVAQGPEPLQMRLVGAAVAAAVPTAPPAVALEFRQRGYGGGIAQGWERTAPIVGRRS